MAASRGDAVAFEEAGVDPVAAGFAVNGQEERDLLGGVVVVHGSGWLVVTKMSQSK